MSSSSSSSSDLLIPVQPFLQRHPSTQTSSSHFSLKFVSQFVMFVIALVGAMILLGISSISWNTTSLTTSFRQSPKFYSIEIINDFPHDPKAYTEGLLYAGNDTLFESTGLYGQSSVRRVALQSGKVEALHMMDISYFGEGLTLLGERLFQLTWQRNTGFIYDRNDLSKIGKFTHQMKDGWGLATDGKVLFGSDGTSTLYHLDLQKLKVIGKHTVKYGNDEVRYLNELEFVNGEVWANVYTTDCIARISQKDGTVIGFILLQNLRKDLIAAGYTGIEFLNGIAWDSNFNRLFVTGKLWPKLYEIKLNLIREHVDNEVIKQLCLP